MLADAVHTLIAGAAVAIVALGVGGADFASGAAGAARRTAVDVHLIGAGNSAGQAALHFANHARKVTLLVRGASLERSMSHYIIDQLRRKSSMAR
jgi:thioredoxin reductase (NADPH)